MVNRILCSVALLLFVFGSAMAQNANLKMKSMKPKTGTVCYASGKSSPTTIAPPSQYLAWKKNPGARVKTSHFQVTYVGFTAEAQSAFQAAVDIWSTLIYSPVTIYIEAHWEGLGPNVLGSATPNTFFANFEGSQKSGIWYPVALAEKMAGKDLNAVGEADIYASFNKDQSDWYYGTGSITGKYDLTSVVLHEIGHGLGATHSYTVSNGTAQIPDYFGVPVIYETFIQNGSAKNLVESFASPSTTLADQITSGALYFNSPLVKKVSSNLARLYAPSTYSAGSSIAHLDETTYPAGNINSLMTPFFDAAEVNHNPGPLVMALLKDMGWNNILIKHTPLPNTENVSQDYPVIGKIKNDTTYDASSVKLTYAINGLNPTTVSMTATGNPNEFSASLPKPVDGSVITTYQYFMSLNDIVPRTFSTPGKLWQQGSTTHTDIVFSFEAGPDTRPPHITHTPISFMRATDTQLAITAVLTDNIGIQSTVVQYQINGAAQSDVAMINTADSTYTATLNFAVADGDLIEYRIKVIDSSVAQNVAYAPTSSTFYSVNVVGLAPTQDSYSNNFNSATTDFFGDNLFNVTTPSGFSDGSINTSHPYPAATPKDSISYVYELRVPIKLKASGSATMKFDEIVLVEPGASGSTWPPYQLKNTVLTYNNFFYYVIVEGSKDGGTTWRRMTKGYDSRDQSVWLTKWNSDVDANGNSLAVGDPSLYKTRTLDMLSTGYFMEGDVIVIRFRLLSDPLAYGWGWSIDNLKIQIDETPPTILHNQLDFVYYKSPSFDLDVKVSDASGVQSLSIDYSINNGPITNSPIPIKKNVDEYINTLFINGLNLDEGDEIEYRINATDSVGNSISFPSTDFLKIAVLNFKNGVATYVSDFNTSNTDFVGNYFSITKPSGFSSAGINSTHPYANGFGLDNTTSYNYILRKPIVVSASNPKILFREILIAEYSASSTKDYAVVEGSKDKGATWHPLLTSYSANTQTVWQNAYNSKANGTESMFKYREIDLVTDGGFVAGDSVVVRFRLFANATNNAWGWAIDDLSIQGTITAVEEIQNQVSVYPNPVSADYVNVTLPTGTKTSSLEMMNSLGQSVAANQLDPNLLQQQVYIGNLNGGVYLMKINVDQQVVTKKIIVSR